VNEAQREVRPGYHIELGKKVKRPILGILILLKRSFQHQCCSYIVLSTNWGLIGVLIFAIDNKVAIVKTTAY